jgi:hypothetical protein
MRLGALADAVAKEYGTDKLGQFAADIGINRNTLERYRSVYRDWKEIWTNPAPEPELVTR